MPFELVEMLKTPGSEPLVSAQRYMELLDLGPDTFAMHAGVDREAVCQTPESPRIQQHLRDNIRRLRAAYDAAGGDMDRTLRWFRHEPLAAFDNHTAQDLVTDGRTDDVVRFVESLKAGARRLRLHGGWSKSCRKSKEYCIRAIAVHEFGHAISLTHEQSRADAPGECAARASLPQSEVVLARSA